MRSARALIASLGASTSLVLAGTLAMAVLSTYVAFSGLPGIRSVSRQAAATTLAPAEPGTEAVGGPGVPAPLALPPATARRPRAAAGSSRVSRDGEGTLAPASRTAGGTARRPKRQAPAAGDAPSIVGGPGTAQVGEPAPARAPSADADLPAVTVPSPTQGAGKAAADTVQGAGKAAAGAVATTAEGAAEAVAPVAPSAAAPVSQAGTAAGDAVQGATDAAAGAVKGLAGGG